MGLLENLRKPTLCGLALFDTVLALLGVYLLILLIRNQFELKLSLIEIVLISLIITIPLGVISHALLGIATPLNCKLGIANSNACKNVRKM